jgi:muramoyltetrapeptide carboxypeptidase
VGKKDYTPKEYILSETHCKDVILYISPAEVGAERKTVNGERKTENEKQKNGTMQPQFLKQGDTIAIAATARKVSMEELQPAITVFESWGLTVKLADGLFEQAHQFAGNDHNRIKALQGLLDEPSVNAIICARGGYGTVRLIDHLDFTAFRLNPKWIIGYSDVTVLHSHVYRHFEIPTLHATMPISMQAFNADAESIESLRKALFGEQPEYHFAAHPLNEPGNATGKLIGGNLSVLYALLGSESDIDTEGCILFLEDLDEYLYHIDRMMMNMKRTGKLNKLAGLIVGGMNDMRDNTIPFGKNAYEIIAEHIAEYSYPVVFGFPAGHEAKNMAMIFGQTATLQSGASCFLKQ